jgi:ABC-type lipoprotein export system ATPase subunit
MIQLIPELRCPFCFKSFPVSRIRFRCKLPTCSAQELDEVYAKERQMRSFVMGKVFAPAENEAWNWMHREVPRKALCRSCNTDSYAHLCPECHFELPHDVGRVRQRIIAIIGGVGTGKSYLIGSLLFALQNEVGTNMQMTVSMLDDDTQKRWRDEFYTPVFEEKKQIQLTQTAAIDARVRIPLVLRLTSENALVRSIRQQLRKVRLLRQLNVERLLFKRLLNTSIFDSSGEDMINLERVSTHVRSIIHADGLIFIIDPLQLDKVRQYLRQLDKDIALPTQNPNSRPISLLDRLFKLFEQNGGVAPGGSIGIPTAFVLSKIDMLGFKGHGIRPLLPPDSNLLKDRQHYQKVNVNEFKAISSEVETYLRDWISDGFCDKIAQRFPNAYYFGVSACGTQHTPTTRPEILEPLHVEEPFLWLLNEYGFIKQK